MKIAVCFLSFLLAVQSFGADAPISVEDAKAKLEEKEKARKAERETIVQITQGELQDLKDKIALLESQLKALKPAVTKETPKNRTLIEVGMTKDEVVKFINTHPLKTVGIKTKTTSGVLVETMEVVRVETETVQTGSKRNALGGSEPVYGTREKHSGIIKVILTGGVVSSVDAR